MSSAHGQYGRNQDEMFLNGQGGPPVVEPLRINKRESTASPVPSANSGSMYTASPPPGTRPGASALPYPDDRIPNSRPTQSSNQPPYPDDGRVLTPDSVGTASPLYGYPPPRTGSASSATQASAEYPQALRPGGGKSTLAERRGGAAPKPLPDSPGPEAPDKEGLFQKTPQRPAAASSKPPTSSYANYNFPPPGTSVPSAGSGKLNLPDSSASSRIDRNPSTSTTKAYRGSPPPPETPIIPPGHRATSEIEARFAAAGIAGTSTLTGLQAQSAAAQQRAHQYSGQPQPQQPQQQLAPSSAQSPEPVRRPWTPTELPGSQPHGPPTVYQGPGEAYPDHSAAPAQAPTQAPTQAPVQAQGPVSYPTPAPTSAPAPVSYPAPASVSYPAPASVSYPAPAPAPVSYPAPTGGNPAPAAHRLSSGAQSSQSSGSNRVPKNALEDDFQRLNVSEEPPPAYASVAASAPNPHYGAEKHRLNTGVVAGGAVAAASNTPPNLTPSSAQGTPQPVHPEHPAFANDHNRVPSAGSSQAQYQQPQQMQGQPQVMQQPHLQQQPQPQQQQQQSMNGFVTTQTVAYNAPPVGQTPASPPPLPEGWIAHLDPSSGQYYYIHLATQSTQWEFPKGPTPLNLNEAPLSPIASVYQNPLSPSFSSFGSKPLPSPGMPLTPGFDTASVMSIGTAMGGPSAFTGPPPSSGVDLYRVVPTNGVYFGPYLRYTNMDLERGIWLGSILLVTDAPQPPTIHIHQSVDLSPNPRQLKAQNIAKHQRWTFFKYEVDLQMDDAGPAKWTYAITSHLGCTRYEFLVAGRHETGWRFVATSGNDFSLSVSANERQRIGGTGHVWKDIMQKHAECGGFHVQLGLGGQINADRLWKEIPSLKQWLATSGKDTRKNATWTAAHEEDVSHAYFHYYTSHFDQPYLREAFAQIPHILSIDDHDIFDGFGSYPEYMQFSNMFKNIGRIGVEMYLLFQHHTTLELLRNISTDVDLFTITGTGWHFVKYLGPCVVAVGPDTRSERTPNQVMAGPTYQGFFPKIAMLPPSVQHCIMMISVPLIYPRLEAAESIAHTVATGKKAVTGAYNILGKVTSSVAGVVGAKDAARSGFDSVKRAVGKSGLMGGILSPFGEIDVLDELRDQWTHDSKDLERTYFIRTLQRISQSRSLRITFMSGAAGLLGSGLVHDPSHPSDHKTMYQLITGFVVNTPPPSYVLKLLSTTSSKPLYIPPNGQRSTPSVPTDTKEDMMEIFTHSPDGREIGRPGDMSRKLMNRRGYVAIVAYDPEVVRSQFGPTDMSKGGGKLSLAADFMVQSDTGGVMKYGPVVVPYLEFGR